ncbi:hypothetical protein GCM10020254_08880 [Streptomyces goshikiensis]
MTRAPRRAGGAISEMYSGTAKDVAPRDSPTRKRPARSEPVPMAAAEASVPAAYTAAAAPITGSRPKRSASRPLLGAVSAAPSRAADTAAPCTQDDRPYSAVTSGRAPAMTPVP